MLYLLQLKVFDLLLLSELLYFFFLATAVVGMRMCVTVVHGQQLQPHVPAPPPQLALLLRLALLFFFTTVTLTNML